MTVEEALAKAMPISKGMWIRIPITLRDDLGQIKYGLSKVMQISGTKTVVEILGSPGKNYSILYGTPTARRSYLIGRKLPKHWKRRE